ncbi:Ppx/GppA phosphatase family protein [Marivirga arenosa]|uniref:Exopolyphosphatase n=1 Tax=Marivirga arenosa TaxID=3059076 RepID=A0AA49GGI9_9BACT|nr:MULTISPECIES: exopolyphosphatase [unclassified Marivirga]WKK81943.2 exopolyphosphatase [Marivirga sp. BKB1-2]WMN07339.1 exopolyphosphatase [Marivirga sp. ABR2-2]
MDKIAIIDLGTNTFHLLIVEVNDGKETILFKEKIAVKLGEGGISKGNISKAAEERAIDTMKYFSHKLKEENVSNVFASATSAMRNASNGKEVIQHIYDETGISVQLISGLEEAKFIHQGVKKALEIGPEPALIMDIGGGSVEFIICDQTEVYWMKSFEIGAQRLLDKFHKHDPIQPRDIEKLDDFLRAELAELKMKMDIYQPHHLIGSSGTFDTLIDIDYQEKNITKPDENSFSLPLEDFDRIYNEIIHKNRDERMKIPGMIEMRVDMIVVAVCLIQFLIENNDFINIKVSTYALKEGLLDAIISNDLNIS